MHDADKNDAIAVAVTRDGRVYLGSVQKGSRIRNRYLARLIWWIGKAQYFLFIRVLRLPYLFDHLRTVKATRLRKRHDA